MKRLAGTLALALGVCVFPAAPQAIQFESGGVKYQTLTRSGVTIMYASLPSRLKSFAILQVAVSNGSEAPYSIKPEDFTYVRDAGGPVRAANADSVVKLLARSGARSDVLKLVSVYETALYGIPNMRSTNGYEQRRQAALMQGPAKIRAAGLASAVALVQTTLEPGKSTDGAVFLPTDHSRPLGHGRVVVRAGTDVFEFNPE